MPGASPRRGGCGGDGAGGCALRIPRCCAGPRYAEPYPRGVPGRAGPGRPIRTAGGTWAGGRSRGLTSARLARRQRPLRSPSRCPPGAEVSEGRSAAPRGCCSGCRRAALPGVGWGGRPGAAGPPQLWVPEPGAGSGRCGPGGCARTGVGGWRGTGLQVAAGAGALQTLRGDE